MNSKIIHIAINEHANILEYVIYNMSSTFADYFGVLELNSLDKF